MKKTAMILIGLILIPAILLSSCGRSESGSTTTASSSTSTASSKPAATVVKVWTEDRHDLEYVQQMISKYNAENTDNIQIELTVVSENYKNMIQLAYQSGDAPDVVGANYLPLNLYADTGILYPLNEFIESTPEYALVNEPETHMYEGLNTSNGNIYWLPSGMRSGVRVIYS